MVIYVRVSGMHMRPFRVRFYIFLWIIEIWHEINFIRKLLIHNKNFTIDNKKITAKIHRTSLYPLHNDVFMFSPCLAKSSERVNIHIIIYRLKDAETWWWRHKIPTISWEKYFSSFLSIFPLALGKKEK